MLNTVSLHEKTVLLFFCSGMYLCCKVQDKNIWWDRLNFYALSYWNKLSWFHFFPSILFVLLLNLNCTILYKGAIQTYDLQIFSDSSLFPPSSSSPPLPLKQSDLSPSAGNLHQCLCVCVCQQWRKVSRNRGHHHSGICVHWAKAWEPDQCWPFSLGKWTQVLWNWNQSPASQRRILDKGFKSKVSAELSPPCLFIYIMLRKIFKLCESENCFLALFFLKESAFIMTYNSIALLSLCRLLFSHIFL